MKCSLEHNFVIYSNQRPDRNNYVTFHDVIRFDLNHQKMYKDFASFKSNRGVETQNLPYDATSILHYTSLQGSIDCFPTCTPTFTSNVSMQI